MTIIYKISPKPLWQIAQQTGVFEGAPIDIADGYIHFSTADQVQETATKHFKGQGDLLLIAVKTDALSQLKWESSRGSALFPHLYDTLALNKVLWVKPLPLTNEGEHIFPELEG